MSDDADLAGELTEARDAAGVAYYTAESKRRALLPAGFCHYCGESVGAGLIFCPIADNACAQDYEYEQARRKANGL